MLLLVLLVLSSNTLWAKHSAALRFSCWSICLIQTTLAAPPARPPHTDRPLWSITNHSSAATPWPLCSPLSKKKQKKTQANQYQPRQPRSVSARPMFPCRVHNPPPQAPITTLHIQVINGAAPVCAARSKVSLTVLVGLRGQTEVTGTLLSFVSELCFLPLALPLQVLATRGRQRLTWRPLLFNTAR